MIKHITESSPGPDGPWFFLYYDGSCYPNPGGEMGMGWAIYRGKGPRSLATNGEYPASPPTPVFNNQGDLVASGAESAGPGTSNAAEYRAIIAGMRKALFFGVRRLVVVGDSQLILRQTAGVWKCKAQSLQKLCKEARGLARCFHKIKFRHIPREDNGYCDALAAEKPAVSHYTIQDRDYKHLVIEWTEGDRLLPDKQAALLRWLWETRRVDSGVLGRIYDISSPKAWRIASGERYTHLTEDHL